MASGQEQLRVLTLNCWGLPDLITSIIYRKHPYKSGVLKARDRNSRFRAIAERLSAFDVVCLQEAWMQSDRDILSQIAASVGLTFSHTYNSGMTATSGLIIISRYPISDVFFLRYRVNGSVKRVDHGDYYVGKGVAFARIQAPSRSLLVFNTHTIAQYSEPDNYLPDRLSQVWELARFVNMCVGNDSESMILSCGDFNFEPNSIEYRLFLQMTGLSDSYATCNDTKVDPGHTIVDVLVDGKGKRIDYIYYKRKDPLWTLRSCKVVFSDSPLSDHYGVSATFSLNSSSPSPAASFSSSEATSSSLSSSVSSSPSSLATVPFASRQQTLVTTASEAREILHTGIHSSLSRRRSLFFRVLLALVLLFFFGDKSSILTFFLTIFVCVELAVGVYVIGEELSGLREAYKEMQYVK